MSKIYVSTYQKYTTGTTKGEWLDLSSYASKDDFLAACAELHSDESEPELMFQDWEEMPAKFVGESFIDDQVWAWLELSEKERETVAIYFNEVDQDATIETALGQAGNTSNAKNAELLRKELSKAIKNGQINSRDELCSFMDQSLGLTITRAGTDYVSVKFPSGAKAVRLKGAMFD